MARGKITKIRAWREGANASLPVNGRALLFKTGIVFERAPVTLYKWLHDEGRTHYGDPDFRWSMPVRNEDGTWTPGEWMEPTNVKDAIEHCSVGLHLADGGQLKQWAGYGNVLCEVETEGPVSLWGDKWVAARARCIRIIDYNPAEFPGWASFRDTPAERARKLADKRAREEIDPKILEKFSDAIDQKMAAIRKKLDALPDGLGERLLKAQADGTIYTLDDELRRARRIRVIEAELAYLKDPTSENNIAFANAVADNKRDSRKQSNAIDLIQSHQRPTSATAALTFLFTTRRYAYSDQYWKELQAYEDEIRRRSKELLPAAQAEIGREDERKLNASYESVTTKPWKPEKDSRIEWVKEDTVGG